MYIFIRPYLPRNDLETFTNMLRMCLLFTNWLKWRSMQYKIGSPTSAVDKGKCTLVILLHDRIEVTCGESYAIGHLSRF